MTALEPIALDVSRGQMAEFACEAFGMPIPEITWMKVSDGSDLSTSMDGINITEMVAEQSSIRTSKLTFLSAEENDQSDYTCIGSNGVTNFINSPESDTVSLEVQGKITPCVFCLHAFHPLLVAFSWE